MSDDFTRYLLFVSPVEGVTAPQTLIRAHIGWLRGLDQARSLVMAGPLVGRPGGLVIIRAESLSAAQRLAASDPFVQHGARAQGRGRRMGAVVRGQQPHGPWMRGQSGSAFLSAIIAWNAGRA